MHEDASRRTSLQAPLSHKTSSTESTETCCNGRHSNVHNPLFRRLEFHHSVTKSRFESSLRFDLLLFFGRTSHSKFMLDQMAGGFDWNSKRCATHLTRRGDSKNAQCLNGQRSVTTEERITLSIHILYLKKSKFFNLELNFTFLHLNNLNS